VGAHSFCTINLIDRWTGVSHGEKQFGVDGQASGFIAPIHNYSSGLWQ
jgi:hypothetical protein